MFARTPRLLLRPRWPEDNAAFDSARALVGYHGVECDLVILARTFGAPRLIGAVGLTRSGNAAQLGLWIVPQCWGLGFATEAARAVIDLARDTLRIESLWADRAANDAASGAVLTKLGFSPLRGSAAGPARYVLPLRPLALAA